MEREGAGGATVDVALELAADGPRLAALVAALRSAIAAGRLPAGSRLPASRTLAGQLALSRGTVVAAYESLIAEGYCEARAGAGTYVVALPFAPGGDRIVPREGSRQAAEATRALVSAWGSALSDATPERRGAVGERFDFSAGSWPDLIPVETLARALRAAMLDVELQPVVDPAGSPRLRQALLATLTRSRGLAARSDQVLVVNGSQQGLDLAARLLLDPGDVVCMEDPGYPRARAVFAAIGARVIATPVDERGLQVDRLPEGPVRLVYVTPSHQYPTGGVLPPERRLALLEWARSRGAWVLEDDYDSEFRYDGPPLPCLQGLDQDGRCLYLGSLSKLLHPALRIGYLVTPERLLSAARLAKNTLDQTTTPILQEALATMFESGDIDAHLRRSLRQAALRRQRLAAACAQYLPAQAHLWPVNGGLHAFVDLDHTSSDRLAVAAERLGVSYVDAARCFDRLESDRAALMLWFGRIPLDLIEPGIARLAQAMRESGEYMSVASGAAQAR